MNALALALALAALVAGSVWADGGKASPPLSELLGLPMAHDSGTPGETKPPLKPHLILRIKASTRAGLSPDEDHLLWFFDGTQHEDLRGRKTAPTCALTFRPKDLERGLLTVECTVECTNGWITSNDASILKPDYLFLLANPGLEPTPKSGAIASLKCAGLPANPTLDDLKAVLGPALLELYKEHN